MEIPVIRNRDNEDFQPIIVGRFVVGHVENVNGDGAREVPEYIPTRSELLELLKYWESEYLRTRYWLYATAQTGSTEIRLIPYARRRVDRIVELLGDDAVAVMQDARREFAAGLGTRRWAKFCRRRLGIDPRFPPLQGPGEGDFPF